MRYIKLIVVFLLLACLGLAGLPNGTTWEVRTTGSNSNGGGFVAGASGTDFSQQASAQFSNTDLASTNGTTNPCAVSAVSHVFIASDVGNIIQLSGANWTAGFYEVVSVSAGLATLDRACGTATNPTSGTWAEGGALLTLAELNTAMNTTANIRQIAWVKATATYSVSSQAVNFTFTTNGCGNCQPQVSGYNSSRGDNGMVTIQASSAINNSMVEISNNNNLNGLTFRNFIIDCNSKSNSYGLQLAANLNTVENIKVTNCTNDGIRIENGSDQCKECYVTGTTGGTAGIYFDGVGASPSQPALCINCVSVSNSVHGFDLLEGVCVRCISANNTGAGHDGFKLSGGGPTWIYESISYNNAQNGFEIFNQNSNPYLIQNSIAVLNGNYGISCANSVQSSGTIFENYNFFEGNTSGAVINLTQGANDVNGSGDPFVNGASNNFALNNTAGAGAAARAAGWPGALLVGGTGFIDIGVLQHQDPAGGASMHSHAIIQ